jgi:hypothetical protein
MTRRIVIVLGVVVALVLGGGALAGATYFAGQLTAPIGSNVFEPDNEIIAVDDATVTLRDEGFAAQDGRWGLQLPQGRHVRLGDLVSRADGGVTWTWEDATGIPPQAGEPVQLDAYVWSGTPAEVGLDWEAVALDGEQGPLPAWYVPAAGEPVGRAVFVHGRGATREESLRFLPLLHAADWEVVVITYRGDDESPTPDARVLFGTEAWPDVTPAVEWQRPEDLPVVLYASSMGGAVVGQWLDRAPGADAVVGVVLDSPVLSLDELLVLQGGLNGVPPWASPVLLPLVQLVADTRDGLGSAALEQVSADGTFDVPVLLFHGDADDFVPVEPSVEFADEHPATTFVRVAEAGHVRTWNVAQAQYEDALATWLSDLP